MNERQPEDNQGTRPCDYCELPVRVSPTANEQPLYCCLGCQLAAAITSDQAAEDGGLGRTAIQLGLSVFFAMNVMVFTMALWSWDTYAIAASPHASILKELLRFACLLFATPVVLILGRPLVINVWKQWTQGVITTDSLLVVGVVAAFAYSVVAVLTGQPHVYFEVACTILVAITLGRWLEAEGKQRAMKSLKSLQNLLPATARLVQPDGSILDKPLAEVAAGDAIRVLPGERFPLDGVVRAGQSFVDQHLVTGEPSAVCRSPGDHVFGGTLNLDGRVDVRVQSSAAEGMIQRLVELVQDAANQTSRPVRAADRLARAFVPLVFLIAVTVFLAHWASSGLPTALMASMAVTLIACPCALAIATPLAIWAALSSAAKQGVVFRTSDDLLTLAEVDRVCFDKTGTLTTDEPRLASVWYDNTIAGNTVLDVAKQLSAQTLHPLGRALGRFVEDHAITDANLVGPASTTAGRGVTAPLTQSTQDGTVSTVSIMGNLEFFRELGGTISTQQQTQWDAAMRRGLSAVCVGWDARVCGIFAFEESLRSAAAVTIRQLSNHGVKSLLLTGDQVERAERIGNEMGLDVASNLMPEDKLNIVAQLQSDGHTVAMLGDGLNDAPALSAADVGIALGCGADVTRDAADICLIAPSLPLLPWTIELARATRRTIRRNLGWAVGYNCVGIALAASGRLNPIWAAVAMVLSSGLVIAESLRLAGRPDPLPETSHTEIEKDALAMPTSENSVLCVGPTS